jgi:hypothetical protein
MKQTTTRIWRRDEATLPPDQPVAQVQDPAMRAILRARRRALLLEVAAIERHCPRGDDEEAEPRQTA